MATGQINTAKADRFLLLMGIGVIAIALFAIFTRNSDKPIAAVIGIERRTLVFTQWWQDEMEGDALRYLIQEFEKQNPDIRIRLDTRSYIEIRDRLIYPENAARTAPWDNAALNPDILGIDPRWLQDLVQGQKLESLELFLAREDESQSVIVSESDEPYTNWVLPLASFMTPLFYNIDILQAAGFDRPPRNQREFLAYARAATDHRSACYGFAISLSPRDPNSIFRDVFSWIWASGIPLVQQGALAFDVPQIRNALALLNDLYQEGSMAQDPFLKTGMDRVREFTAGQIAMMIGSVSDISTILDSGISFGITTIPNPPEYLGMPRFNLQNWYVGISSSCKYMEDAWKFIRFLYDHSALIGASAAAQPRQTGNSSLSEPLYAKINDISAAGEAQRDFYNLSRVDILERIVRDELRLMFSGFQSPAETAQVVQRRWDSWF